LAVTNPFSDVLRCPLATPFVLRLFVCLFGLSGVQGGRTVCVAPSTTRPDIAAHGVYEECGGAMEDRLLPPSVSVACALEMCSCWFTVAVGTWAPLSITSPLPHASPFSRLQCAAAPASTPSLLALRPTGCDARAWGLATRAPRGAAGSASPPRCVARGSQRVQPFRRAARRTRRRRHANKQRSVVAQHKSTKQPVWTATASKSNKQAMGAENPSRSNTHATRTRPD